MSHQLNRLLRAFRQAEKGPPADLQKVVSKLPEPGALLSPWDSWALLGLIQYQRNRQRWVAEFVRTQLQVDSKEMENGKSPEDSQERQVWGFVPERPGWRYVLYVDTYEFSNQETGEVIEMSNRLDPPEYTEGSDYCKNLRTLHHPEPEVVRLKELDPKLMLLDVAWDDLLAAKALKRLPRKWTRPVRVTEKVLGFLGDIDSFLQFWREPNQRLWLAALIGDWLAADALAKDLPEIQKITARRKEQTELLRRDRLTRGDWVDEFAELFGLAQLGAADESLAKAFQGRPNEISLSALEVVQEQNDGRWCLAVHDLLTRLNPEGRFPEPEIGIGCLKYLFKHGFEREILLKALAKTGKEAIGDGVLLALEHSPKYSPESSLKSSLEEPPDFALQLIRRDLRSEIHYCRIQTSMILAFLDKSWSRRELWQLLSETNDRKKTLEVRAALRELQESASDMAVRDWENKNLWGASSATAATGVAIPVPSHERAGDQREVDSYRVRIRELREKDLDWLRRIRDRLPVEPEK